MHTGLAFVIFYVDLRICNISENRTAKDKIS